jgi:hypothetical protein
VDTSNRWNEIQAFNGDTNIAAGKTVTASTTITTNPASTVTNGTLTVDDYITVGTGTQYVQIDLGASYEIGKIVIFHYWGDGRTYHGTKTQVSTDGTTWTTVFDSTSAGEYAESADGHTVMLLVKKYLIKSADKLYTVVSGSASEITGTLNAELFWQYGVDSLSSAVLLTLPNPSILYWQNIAPLAGVYATVTAIPYPQVVVTYEADMSDATIAGIKSITPNLDVTGNGKALFAISFDGGTTYNAYTGTAWQTLDITSTDDFIAKGMTAAILSAITQQQWSDFLTTHTTQKYKIAVLLNRPSIDDNIRIKSIQVLYLNQ